MLKVLDLFSGIGGFSLGLERTGGFETVAFCEIDPYCRAVLRKHWPDVPIHEDVRTLRGDEYGPIDVICGGYPCQPFSLAGQRRSAKDDRHLWPEVHRLMASIRPAWGLFENVAGHISMGLDQVLSDLESEEYTAWPVVIPACAVDAPHRRDRVWIVAYAGIQQHKSCGQAVERASSTKLSMADSNGMRVERPGAKQSATRIGGKGKNVANANCPRLSDNRGGQASAKFYWSGATGYSSGDRRGGAEWVAEPDVGRVAHGVPSRVDRLRALGNAVVPQIPEMIGRAILEAEKNNAT